MTQEDVSIIKMKDLQTELKRTGETFEYTSQGYFTSANEWNEVEVMDKETKEMVTLTIPSYGLPNRDTRQEIFLNPKTRAHTQFKEFLAKNEDNEGDLKNREFKLTFRARLSTKKESAQKKLYVVELANIQVTDKTFDVVGFLDEKEEAEGESAPAKPQQNEKFSDRVTPDTKKKLEKILAANELDVPPALADGTMLESKAKGLLNKLLLLDA